MQTVRRQNLFLFAFSLVIGVQPCVLPEPGWFPPVLRREDAQSQIEALNRKGRERNLTPGDYYQLGALYLLHTPSTDLATGYLRQAVRLGVKDPMAGFLYSLALERRGYYAKAMKPLLRICEEAPDLPVGELAARTIASYRGYVEKLPETVEPVFRKLFRRADYANPDFVHIFKQTLAGLQERSSQPDKERQIRATMGQVTRWKVTGTFGHLPNLDFDSVFPPENEGSPSGKYEWDGKEVAVRDEVFEDDPVRPGGKDRRKGTFYATTYVPLASDQKVVLRLDSRDNVKLSVDANCALVLDGRRDWQRHEKRLVLHLRKGWHRVLVKSNSDAEPSGFRLYLTDLCGSPIADAPGQTAFESCPEVAGLVSPEPEAVPNTAEWYCDKLLEKDGSDPWAYFVKAWVAAEAGDMVAARVEQERCVRMAPDFAEFHFYLARYCKDDPSLSPEDSSARSRQAFRRAADLAEDFATALDEVSDFDIDENHHLRAIRTLQKCVNTNPYYWGYHFSLFSAYRSKGWNDPATVSLQNALSLNPDAQNLLSMGREWFEGRRDFRREAECELALQKMLPRSSRKADQLVEQGKLLEAAREYQRLIDLKPKEPDYRSSLADVYRKMGEFGRAEEEINRAIDLSERPESLYPALATVLFEKGDTKGGREMLRKALNETPIDLSLRQALVELGEKDEFQDFRVSLEQVLKERDANRQYQGVSTVYFLDQYVSRIFPDGSSLDLTHIIAKVLDKGGVERMGEIHIPRHSRIYHLRVVKPDGETLDPEIIPNKDSYSMSGLAPGDIVEYEHLAGLGKLSIPKAHRGANFTFNSIEIPTERAQLVLMTAPGYPLQFRFRNAQIEPKVETRGDMVVYQWDMKNPTAVHSEPRPVPYQEHIPHVQFSGGLTWDNVRLEYANRLLPLLTVSPEMKKASDEAVKDVSDPFQRAVRIFRMAEEQIKNPAGSTYLGRAAHLVFSERAGNMLVVLKALYDYVGVPCDVLFAYSQAQALPVLDVPNLGVYQFGLIRLRLPGNEQVWIEPAQRRLPFGYISPAFGGTQALRVIGEAPTVVDVPAPPSEQDDIVVRWEGKVSESGDIEVAAQESFSGALAGMMRRLAESYTEQKWSQFLERNLSASVRGAAVSDVRLENIEDFERPVTLKYRFQAPGYARREDKSLRVEQVFGRHEMVRRFAPLPGRKIPLLLQSPLNDVIQTTLTFPKGSKLVQKPAPAQLSTPFGRYEVTVDGEADVLKVTRSLRQPIQRITPGDYLSYAKFCQAIDQNELHETVVQLAE